METRTVLPLCPPTHLFLTSRCVTLKLVTLMKPLSLSPETCQNVDTVFLSLAARQQWLYCRIWSCVFKGKFIFQPSHTEAVRCTCCYVHIRAQLLGVVESDVIAASVFCVSDLTDAEISKEVSCRQSAGRNNAGFCLLFICFTQSNKNPSS